MNIRVQQGATFHEKKRHIAHTLGSSALGLQLIPNNELATQHDEQHL